SNLREQLIGAAYVWWALAVIAITGLTFQRQSAPESDADRAVDEEAAEAADEPFRPASAPS
ncbi:MAG: hypothetical protein ACRDTO_15610, partial [Mycobacterium sp.]